LGRELWQWVPSTLAVQPHVVDRLGNVGYGEERIITVATPDLENIIENYLDGDISTEDLPPIEGTAVASQGIAQICVRTATTGSCIAPAGNPLRYHWAYAREFPVFGGWEDGTHDTTVSVRDTTGAEYVSDPMSIIVDTTPPTAAFTSPAEGAVITGTGRITITGTASDATSGLAGVRFSPDNTASWREASLDGNAWQATWNVPAGLDGATRHLVVEAADRGSLTTHQTIAVTVDNVLPSGFTPVTFSPEEGEHTFTGVQFQAAWLEPDDGSGIAGVYAALDTITDTLPTEQVTGNAFQTDFPAEGTYFFHLLVEDNAGNRVVGHYGPWYVEVPGLPPVSSIIVDGVLDIEHYEWLPDTERLGQDDRSGQPQELFISWDEDQVFLGWQGADPGVDGDLLWYFDTGPGGISDFGFRISDFRLKALSDPQSLTLWDLELERMGAVQWTLPFEADAYFIFRGDGSFDVYRWDGGAWNEVTDERVQAVHGPENDTEAAMPFDLLGVSGAVQMLALARRPGDGPVWAVLPDTNPLAGPWTSAYNWPGWTWDVIPNAGQPDAGLTWLHLDSPQPSGLYLPVGGIITYNLLAGNAATYGADEARLTLTGEGVVFETFSGQGTCTDCPPGSDAWTVELGTLPARDQVAITVTARTLDTGGATAPVTTTVHLAAALPDAEPEDNLRSLSHLVDGTPPTATVIEPRGGGTIQSGPQEVIGTAQAGRGAPVALVEFSTDGTTWQPADGSVVWLAEVDVPVQGTLTLHVRATDEAGNVGPVTTATFTADDMAPVSAITLPEEVVGGEEYELAGTAHDPFPEGGLLEDVEVRVDDGPWAPVDSLLWADSGYAWRFDWSLPEGEEAVVHTVQARALDAAGNVGESAPVEIVVDTMGPRSEIAYPTDGTWLEPDTTQIVVWGWTEDGIGVTRVEISLDGGLTWTEAMLADEAQAMLTEKLQAPASQPETWNPKPETATLWAFAGPLPEGEVEYYIRARGVDVAGNVEAPGPGVVVHTVVSRIWLPLVLKN
ncbi:MAG: Ig-like domain-containing protein, partial [Anaerolineae bacterium]